MASLAVVIPIFYQVSVLLISHMATIFSQDPSTPSPTIAQCTSRLLPLLPCTLFVQGNSPSPAQSCCNILNEVDSQEPHCLCVLLRGTALSFFPINRTLPLQLPSLCNLQVNISCPGDSGVQVPLASPASQVSLGTKDESTIAASPEVSMAPMTSKSIIGLELRSREANDLKAKDDLALLMAMAILLLPLVSF